MRKFAHIISMSLGIFLVACGGNVGNQSNIPSIVTPYVSIDDVGVISSIDGNPTKSYLFVHNYGDSEANNVEFSFDSNSLKDTSDSFSIDSSNCNSIPAQSSCVIALTASAKANSPINTTIKVILNGKVSDYQPLIVHYSPKVDSVELNKGIDLQAITETTLTSGSWYTTVLVSLTNEKINNFKSLKVNSSDSSIAKVVNAYCPSSNLSYGDTCSVELKINPNAYRKAYRMGNYSITQDIKLTPIAISESDSNIIGNPLVLSFLEDGLASIISPSVINATQYGDVIKVPVINSDVNIVKNLELSLNNQDLDLVGSTCTDTLKPYNSCYYMLKVKDHVLTNATAQVKLSYSRNDTITDVKTVNISYLGNPAEPSMEALLSDNEFITDNITPIVKQFVIVNNGVRPLTNLSLSLPNITGFISPDNTCQSITLEKGQSCAFTLEYNPKQEQSKITDNIMVHSKYIDTNGVVQDYSIPFTIVVEAVNLNAVLNISPVTSNSFDIIANNSESATNQFAIINTGSSSTKIANLINMQVPNGFTINVGTCTDGQELNANESCTFSLTYGPVSTAISDSSSNLNFSYEASLGVTHTASFLINYKATENLSAVLNISPVISNAFNIIANNSESATNQFMIRNTGNFSTKISNLINMQLPTDFTINVGTCTDGKELDANESCTFSLTYGPVSTPISESSNLNFSYEASSGVTHTASFVVNYKATENNEANLIMTGLYKSNNIRGEGINSSKFEVYQNESAIITLAYKNDAINTNAIAKISETLTDASEIGQYEVIENTCLNAELRPQDECYIKLKVDTSAVGENNLTVPSFTYTDPVHLDGYTVEPNLGAVTYYLNVVN